MSKLAIDGGAPVRTKPFPEWPVYGETEEKLLMEVLRSGKWGGTGRVKLPEAEERFAALHEAKHAVTVVNGTVAITVALLAAGVQAGDEVIVPPYTFYATAAAPLMLGAIPVFADVEENTLLLDPEQVEALITPRTKAIIPVHIGGGPANMTRLREIAAKHGLRIIEDSAQAVGARWDGRPVGAIGDLGTFSFQSSKNMNAGEGGMIVTNDPELADKAWSLTNAGRIRGGEWYQHEVLGWNLRMTEFQAAILLGQLTRLEEQMLVRERNARLLTELLLEIDGVQPLQYGPKVTRHAYHLYLFKIDPQRLKLGKREFFARMNAEGIPVHEGYVPLNRNRAILDEVRKRTGEARIQPCPVAERACGQEALWLPQNVLLGGEEDVRDIAAAFRKVVQSA
ncbi:glutamine--scyllo-inositol aminotransferase [Gordoniibacillus kamchatkensis]|uniref:Glutamine--scyllo-inositol aminotransferase n=1 Tax=Gordoniibacillus kamchatkensis TaxID=1590651 RepID=A0ABR5AK06_9BACL|nr:DegT/DnrJ/EryC1/StrS family aminotransferase [Paenibacillus sp. VKM B-2647]KIL41368.1 glutamine--scyllo-inositol aminotransferase [Paenibacillus sp. VKM B-2647]